MANKEIVWTHKAEVSLERIYNFIALDSEVYAYQFVKNLILYTENCLETGIATGRLVPAFENTPLAFLHEIIYKGYRIIYNQTPPNQIYIIIVISGRMNVTGQF